MMRWNMHAALSAYGIYVDGSHPTLSGRWEHAYALGAVCEKARQGVDGYERNYKEVLEDIVDFDQAFTFVRNARSRYPHLLDDILEGYVEC